MWMKLFLLCIDDESWIGIEEDTEKQLPRKSDCQQEKHSLVKNYSTKNCQLSQRKFESSKISLVKTPNVDSKIRRCNSKNKLRKQGQSIEYQHPLTERIHRTTTEFSMDYNIMKRGKQKHQLMKCSKSKHGNSSKSRVSSRSTSNIRKEEQWVPILTWL